MIDGIEDLYKRIANSIQESIPGEWRTATLDAIFYPDSSTYFGEYARASDGVARDFETSFAVGRAFRELRKKFEQAGKPLWGRATFKLQSDGKFNMTFGYDDCDENGSARFDEEEEVKRHNERHKRLTGGAS